MSRTFALCAVVPVRRSLIGHPAKSQFRIDVLAGRTPSPLGAPGPAGQQDQLAPHGVCHLRYNTDRPIPGHHDG